jgi:hypothetical protein
LPSAEPGQGKALERSKHHKAITQAFEQANPVKHAELLSCADQLLLLLLRMLLARQPTGMVHETWVISSAVVMSPRSLTSLGDVQYLLNAYIGRFLVIKQQASFSLDVSFLSRLCSRQLRQLGS